MRVVGLELPSETGDNKTGGGGVIHPRDAANPKRKTIIPIMNRMTFPNKSTELPENNANKIQPIPMRTAIPEPLTIGLLLIG